jgi:hypothetical protein
MQRMQRRSVFLIFSCFETRSSPESLGATHRAFAFYLGNPISSIPGFLISFSLKLRRCPSFVAATLAALPSMSLLPVTPFLILPSYLRPQRVLSSFFLHPS